MPLVVVMVLSVGLAPPGPPQGQAPGARMGGPQGQLHPLDLAQGALDQDRTLANPCRSGERGLRRYASRAANC